MGNSRRSAESGKRSRGKAAKAAANGAANGGSEAAPPPSFEAALERLEGSVARLEEGEMPLEEALELFESGVKLSRQCQSTLEEAERRIEILVADRDSESGGEKIVAFDSDEEEGEDDEAGFED